MHKRDGAAYSHATAFQAVSSSHASCVLAKLYKIFGDTILFLRHILSHTQSATIRDTALIFDGIRVHTVKQMVYYITKETIQRGPKKGCRETNDEAAALAPSLPSSVERTSDGVGCWGLN